jgi:hypothetical protein
LWRERIVDAMDGTWSEHSCRLATGLVHEHPEWVRVEPQASFSAVEHTPHGIRELLESTLRPQSFERSYSVHLCAHLWWADERRDFSAFSATQVTEAHIRQSDSALALLARPFLPSHGLF